MRVLLIHQAFVSGQEAGGTRHFEFGQFLAEHGDHLAVVASQVSYLTGLPTQPGRNGLVFREESGGVTVLRAYAPSLHHASFVWRLFAFVVFAALSVWAGLRSGPADIVMGTSPPIFQAFSAWAVARLRRKPFLIEIRDLWPEFAIDMGLLPNPFLQSTARSMERFLYRRADHLLVNSPAYRDYLLAKGIAAARISVVSNGVDASMFDPAASGEEIRRRYGLGDAFVVVYAGAHGMANDLGVALRAAALLRDQPAIHFLFVGDGKERANLQREATELGLTNVTFAGSVPKADMPGFLAAADACLAILMNIKMFTTTYPNKVFDYMAAGRPTILAIGGVIRDVIEAAGGGIYVPPGDAPALARAITSLYHQPERRTQLGAAARTYVVEHFDRASQAAAFRQVLQGMVERSQQVR